MPKGPSNQSQLQRAYNRHRIAMLQGWKELEKRADRLTKNQPRRVQEYVHGCVDLHRTRSSTNMVEYLGAYALSKTGRQSRSSNKRAKRDLVGRDQVRQGGQTWDPVEPTEGCGELLVRVERGGGRLLGARKSDGRLRGKADGVVPGPAVTGWAPEDYDNLLTAPPPAPPPAERPDETHEERGDRWNAEFRTRRYSEKALSRGDP